MDGWIKIEFLAGHTGVGYQVVKNGIVVAITDEGGKVLHQHDDQGAETDPNAIAYESRVVRPYHFLTASPF